MSVLLVTYDLSKPGQKYDDFYEVIKKGAYARLSESSYAIVSQESPKAIYEKLAISMDKNDHVYITTLQSPYWGYGPQEVNDWLAKNL